MKVLHLVSGLDPEKGGVGQAVRLLIKGLSELRIYNEVVCMDPPASSFIANETFIISSAGPGKGAWCYSKRLTPFLLENLPRFDAVIVHGLWQYHTYAIRTAMSSLRKRTNLDFQKISLPKLFVMPHGMLDPYFQRATGRKWKAFRNMLFWKFTESKLVNTADGLLFTCLTELQLAREPFRPYQPKKEFVIGLGSGDPPTYEVSMKQAFIEKCPNVRDGPYFLFLSRIHEKKGLDILVKAYQDVFEDCKNIPKLVIAGPGVDTPFGQQIQQLIVNAKLQSQVLFTGMLTGLAKWGAFYNCEAFILVSHQENFGIAVVEALACSKPVLISYQINIWREINEAGGGMVATDNIQGANDLLVHWVGMKEREKLEMGIKARTCYDANFAILPVAGKLLKALHSEQSAQT